MGLQRPFSISHDDNNNQRRAMTGKKDKQTSISTRKGGGGKKTEDQGGSGGAAPARPAGSERELKCPKTREKARGPQLEIGAHAPLDEISHLVTREPKRWM
jgi:hypothetical protein